MSKTFQDSLVALYSEKAWEFGYNHPQWQESWDNLLAVCPNVAYAYREKAIPYLKNGNYAEGFGLVNKAVALDPAAWVGYRGFLHCIFTKNYEKALEDLGKAEELTPGAHVMDHSYDFYKGLAYMELGNYPEAEASFLADLAGQPAGNVHYASLLYLGIFYLETRRYERAEELLLKSLEQYEQLPETNYYLALTFRQAGKLSESHRYLERAKEYFSEGYRLNEDNVVYVNYPRQISAAELGR